VKGWLIVYALFLIYQTGSGIYWLMQNIGHMPVQQLVLTLFIVSFSAFAIYSLKNIGQAWVRNVHLILNGASVVLGLPGLLFLFEQILQGNIMIFLSQWALMIIAPIVWIVLWLVSPRVKSTQNALEYPGAPSGDVATGEAATDDSVSGGPPADLKSFFTAGRVISFVISIPMIIGAFQIFAWGESNNFHLFTLIAGLPLLILGGTIFIAGLLGKNGAVAAFGVFGVILRLLSK
jgi:hypothetical protein